MSRVSKDVMLMNRIGPSQSELYVANADGPGERKLPKHAANGNGPNGNGPAGDRTPVGAASGPSGAASAVPAPVSAPAAPAAPAAATSAAAASAPATTLLGAPVTPLGTDELGKTEGSS